MIDLHNHILPGLDDGAADLAESLRIARHFVDEGVTRAAATPHLNPVAGTGSNAATVRAGVERVRAALEDARVPLDLAQGNEVFLAPDVPEMLEAGEIATLGGGRAILVELPFEGRPAYTEEVIERLFAGGYTPVLAHPERSGWLSRDAEAVEWLLDAGVPLQLTAASLLGHYGIGVQSTAHALLRGGAYSLAASDRHHPQQPRSLATLHAAIAAVTDERTADLLLSVNPAHILAGEPVARPAVMH